MLKRRELKCPKCGGKLKEIDCYDYNHTSDKEVSFFCVGECQECHTEFQWREEYTFKGIEDLEEIH